MNISHFFTSTVRYYSWFQLQMKIYIMNKIHLIEHLITFVEYAWWHNFLSRIQYSFPLFFFSYILYYYNSLMLKENGITFVYVGKHLLNFYPTHFSFPNSAAFISLSLSLSLSLILPTSPQLSISHSIELVNRNWWYFCVCIQLYISIAFLPFILFSCIGKGSHLVWQMLTKTSLL